MSEKMREALEQCLSVLSLGHQVGPYAYAGENMDRYMKDAAARAKAALAEQPAQTSEIAIALKAAAQRGATSAEVRSQRIGYVSAETGASRETVEALLIASGRIPEQRGEVAGWLTDQGTFHFDKTEAWNDSEGFIEPLYTAPPAPVVPEGWKLVPVVPTEEMTKAVRYDEDAFGGKSAWPSDIWRDMLRAAPEIK